MIQSGNLNNQKDAGKRGWFIGHFLKKDNFFKTNEFEVKWEFEPKGKVKSHHASNKTAKTITILIKGKFVVKFPKEGKEIILKNQGDFAAYDANIIHMNEALEDTTLITIRWPSIPDDQVPSKS